jgi:pimeloyl-ACP methyl ester carboxylesterase
LLDGAADRLLALSSTNGPVSIVGFSLGGLFGRWLALRSPERVRQVISVCSPIHEPARNFWLPLHHVLHLWRGHDLRSLAEQVACPLPVPCTVLYSRSDGLVNWPACVDTACPEDCIEIAGPHVLIACNAQVMGIVAERLARSSATADRQ